MCSSRMLMATAFVTLRPPHIPPQRHHHYRLFASMLDLKKNANATTTAMPTTIPAASISLKIPTPQDMEEVGAVLSRNTGPGDILLLGGDLGAGKTCFSRGFIRARTGDLEQPVTSPTYLLSNTYEANGVLIHHMDLYRLSGDETDLMPLNLDHVFGNCTSLVEWPERLGNRIPNVRLDVTLTIFSEETAPHPNVTSTKEEEDDTAARIMILEPHGDKWIERVQFLVEEGYLDDLLLIQEEEDGDQSRS